MKYNILKISLLFSLLIFSSCHRNDNLEDDLPQEEISNVLLLIKDNLDGSTNVYNYQVNGSSLPTIKLKNGREYSVQILLKNGIEDETQSVKDAKDEHFFVFDFPNSDIDLTRLDDATSTRNDGNKIGLLTKWIVNNAAKSTNAQLILTLYHEPISVTENSETSGNGKIFGTHYGGETDLKAAFNIEVD